MEVKKKNRHKKNYLFTKSHYYMILYKEEMIINFYSYSSFPFLSLQNKNTL